MKNNSLTLSIVIPAYNEERYIKACLEAIARQTVPPDEVIVVDNNSTDKTTQIVKAYPFVKLLYEKRQHQSFAQKTGFDAAIGDIIGRIDGDSILPPDWIHKVKKEFETNQQTIAVTGGVKPLDIRLKRLGATLFIMYNTTASYIAGVRLMWGANCALRRSAWLPVSSKVLQRADIWEDFDLAFCLKNHGKLKFLKGIEVGVSFRAVHNSPLRQLNYQFRSVRTFALRTNPIKTMLFVLSRSTVILVYFLVLLDQYILSPLIVRSKSEG